MTQLVLIPGAATDRVDPEPQFPIAPLADLVGDASLLAEFVGFDRTWVGRRIQRGKHLDFYEADRWAVACGYLPWDVWPEWREAEAEEVAS